MFYSQCLLSRKGPLGSVWVAAYCHKRLKKNQVTETDIPFSVVFTDKILLDGVPVVTYRVLGYLLLGVVRIYSKKVEYLFEDCHDMWSKVKESLVAKKRGALRDTQIAPYHFITQPISYNLDAFDFGLLEENNVGNGSCSSSGKFRHQGVPADLQICCTANTLDEEYVTLPHRLMDIDVVVSPLHYLSNLEASTEKLLEYRFLDSEMVNTEEFSEIVRPVGEELQVEKERIQYPDVEMFCGGEEEPPDLRPCGKAHDIDMGQLKCPEMTSSENRELHVFEKHPLSVTVDATPESKLPDVSGAKTPEFMVIPTPANKERVRTLRKRKCVIDEVTVLSNKMLRESIHDSSGLVCKRRKAPHTPLDAWKARRIIDLSEGFSGPLIPCDSLELRSLFSSRKRNTTEQDGTLEFPRTPAVSTSSERVLPGTQNNGESSEPTTTIPEKVGIVEPSEEINLPRALTNGLSSEPTEKRPEQVGAVEETEKTNLPGTPNTAGSQIGGRFEPIPMTPETPVQCSTSKEVSEISVLPMTPETPVQCSTSKEVSEISFLDGVRSVSSLVAVEKKASVSENQELDLSLMNEEINLSEGDPVLVADGWSVRTRMAARYLCKSFLNRKQRKEDDVLNLLEIVKGRTKKESARFFYEILVLKSKGLIDVKQENVYGDILVSKLAGMSSEIF